MLLEGVFVTKRIIVRLLCQMFIFAAKKAKKAKYDKESLLNTPPNMEEQKLVHDIFMKSVDTNDIGLNRRVLPGGCMWMEDSSLTSCFFPHPEVILRLFGEVCMSLLATKG